MSINLVTKPIKKIELSENKIKEIIKDILLEELGSFNNQYEVAKFCCLKAKEMLDNNINELIVDTDKFSDEIKKVKICLLKGATIRQADGFDPETKKAIITIGTLNIEDKSLFKRLPSSISHELMHCNIYLKLYFANKPYFDIDNYTYNKLFSIINKQTCGLFYEFAYALYSTYYQEVNAFVSQVSGEIMDNIDNKISKEDFKNLYKKTNSVITFNNNIKICNKILNSLSDNVINNLIVNNFLKEGIKININEVKKHAKRIINISQNALKDCQRNAMIAFNTLKENGFLL